jgi:electron transfer flavoprotein alpha subunit
MSQGILVFIEQRKGQLRKASLEALSEAVRKVKSVGGDVVACIIGDAAQTNVAELTKYHCAKILVAEGPQFAEYATEAYAFALAEAIKQVDPKYVFSAHTAMAKDLIPRVAARLDAPCVTDVMEVHVNDQSLQVIKPIYSAKAYGKIAFNNNVAFITLRPNVFAAEPSANGTEPAIEKLTINLPEIRAKVVETHVAAGQKIELSEASIIVSGGRGIKGPENWPVLQKLCDALGAALGASRAVVDAGWIDHGHQVGQTGKTVSPQLYIACGISGAIQHIAGMSSSKVIVAINKDPEAPIFKQANYAVVGDVLEIVPKLTEEVNRLHSNS